MKKLKFFFMGCALACGVSSCVSFIDYTRIIPPDVNLKEGYHIIQYVLLFDESKLDFDSDKRIALYTSGVKKAIELLLPMADSDDPKISNKAAHNLAVAYEAQGDMKKSDYWKARSK